MFYVFVIHEIALTMVPWESIDCADAAIQPIGRRSNADWPISLQRYLH